MSVLFLWLRAQWFIVRSSSLDPVGLQSAGFWLRGYTQTSEGRNPHEKSFLQEFWIPTNRTDEDPRLFVLNMGHCFLPVHSS